MYSIALGLRCFKWKMMNLSKPNALLFLQLLIALITRSALNVCFISMNLLFVSLVTNRVSLEEVCLPIFDVLNGWLNLVARCLDDENKLPLKGITSFSASRFALLSIPLIILHSLVISVFWSMFTRKSLYFSVCVYRYGFGCYNSVLAGQSICYLFYGDHLVCSSCQVSLLLPVPHGFCVCWKGMHAKGGLHFRPPLLVCICPSGIS